MNGGGMMDGNDKKCAEAQQKCRSETCRGRKVVKNQCSGNGATTKCECEGGSQNREDDASTLATLGLSSIFVAMIVSLIFA
jgi:hypothetical protein